MYNQCIFFWKLLYSSATYTIRSVPRESEIDCRSFFWLDEIDYFSRDLIDILIGKCLSFTNYSNQITEIISVLILYLTCNPDFCLLMGFMTIIGHNI